LSEQVVPNHQSNDLSLDGPVIPTRMTMSHAGFDQGPQIIAEFEHHGRTPAGPDPT
jgi:hypothetical protein